MRSNRELPLLKLSGKVDQGPEMKVGTAVQPPSEKFPRKFGMVTPSMTLEL